MLDYKNFQKSLFLEIKFPILIEIRVNHPANSERLMRKRQKMKRVDERLIII